MGKLTLKQENFCQAYVKNGGNASAAYREAYNASRMKPETVNRKASFLLSQGKIRARIAQLQKEAQRRTEVTIDKVVKEAAKVAFVDVGDLFNDDGTLRPLGEIEQDARKSIASIEKTTRSGEGGFEESVKVKLHDKLKALDMLMRHLGGYERDNKQKQNEVIVVGEVKEFDQD